jgi:hypothetical protein
MDRLLAFANEPAALEAELAGGLVVTARDSDAAVRLSARQVGELLAFEMADMADQQFSWQVEAAPATPGALSCRRFL